MRVIIAGAGSVGRSVARELLDKEHSVLLIDQSKEALGHERIPGAEWLLSDACELAGLAEAGLEVLRFSFRGHGSSAGTSRGATIAGEMLDLQERIVTGLGIEPRMTVEAEVE